MMSRQELRSDVGTGSRLGAVQSAADAPGAPT
jgi:hypothetical protein